MQTNQILIRVDSFDNFLGYAPRTECHSGYGLHHRAPIVLLENEKGEILLQKRKHMLFDNLWDISVTTHVLHHTSGDETYEEASRRALTIELGLTEVQLTLTHIGFNYFAYDKDYCENEYCQLLYAISHQTIRPNSEVVYTTKWIKIEEFVRLSWSNDLEFTPWAIMTGKAIK